MGEKAPVLNDSADRVCALDKAAGFDFNVCWWLCSPATNTELGTLSQAAASMVPWVERTLLITRLPV